MRIYIFDHAVFCDNICINIKHNRIDFEVNR